MLKNIQHEFFIWEEKNLIEQPKNCENKSVSETNDITNITQIESTQTKWQNITDPKLREKMRKKEWYENNKDKVKVQTKVWREVNKDNRKLWEKLYYQTIKDKKKTFYDDNKEDLKKYNSVYYHTNKNKTKVWREVNKDKIKSYKNEWRKLNKDKIKNYHKRYRNNRLKTNIQYKLSCNLRSRLRIAINKNYKSGSAVRDLGCTVTELKTYLESKFQSGMNWDNYGYYGWHIDHIKPLANFDLTNRQQFLEACHYTNLQPMWAKDNLSKGKKLIYTQLHNYNNPQKKY